MIAWDSSSYVAYTSAQASDCLLYTSCRELDQSYDSTLQRIMDKFSLSRSEAEARMREYWKA